MDEDSYIIPTDKYENIDKFMEEYTGEDLKFFYVVKKITFLVSYLTSKNPGT